MKKALIILGSLAIVGTGVYLWLKQPVVVINYNDKTGEGNVKLGNKTASFKAGEGVVLGSWNGYEISVQGTTGKYLFRRYGKSVESSDGITPYDNGSSYITINHI
jgi:hypothetical protein